MPIHRHLRVTDLILEVLVVQRWAQAASEICSKIQLTHPEVKLGSVVQGLVCLENTGKVTRTNSKPSFWKLN